LVQANCWRFFGAEVALWADGIRVFQVPLARQLTRKWDVIFASTVAAARRPRLGLALNSGAARVSTTAPLSIN